MFVIFLKFSGNKANAAEFIDGHNAWIKTGFDDGVFLTVGSLQPNLGGAIIAHDSKLEDIQERINNDPFVINNVVTAEINEISPAKADKRLEFLLT